MPPGTRVPLAHFHQVVDEAVYGLEGIMTYTVNGERREIGPGAHCFVARGAVHHFTNVHAETARVLTVLSPASIGPAYFREISPVTYADRITTPLLIQHSERDIRTTVGQAEALFTVLRSNRRPVRLLRVPEETHELTRSGTPFRRVENLRIVLDWFRHFLVEGKSGMPPLPKVHGGR